MKTPTMGVRGPLLALLMLVSGAAVAQDGPPAVPAGAPAAPAAVPVGPAAVPGWPPAVPDAPAAVPVGVVIAAPPPGQVVGGIVEVQATASAAGAVQFELDGYPLVAPMTAPPYIAAWNTRLFGDGDHVLTAVAIDRTGARAVSPGVRVTVRNAMPRPRLGR